jgi:hypothetical protein
MTIELNAIHFFYITMFLIWWCVGYFFSGMPNGGGSWFGPGPSDRSTIRFISFWPWLILCLVFHLVVLS